MYQGQMDGLCGPYAIVNALSFCGLADHSQALFQTACSSVSARRWPEVLWEGTTYGDLKRMVSACIRSDANFLGVSASYPFDRRPPNSNQDFWIRFDNTFDDASVYCTILRMWEPWNHWIVAFRETPGGRISFVDTDPIRGTFRKNRASIYAGDRRRKRTQWRVDRGNFIVFKA